MMTDKFATPFNLKLAQDKEDVAEKNTLNSYFPIRTNEKPFDWDAVIGLVLRNVLRREVGKYSLDEYEKDCQLAFEHKLDEEEFWDVLRAMYFENKDIFSVSPEMLLFRAKKGEFTAVDERISKMFINLLGNMRLESFDGSINFIEKEFLKNLNEKVDVFKANKIGEKPYLPVLTNAFREDFKFLAKRPKYLMKEFEQFLSFYAFSYTAQLSLSLPDWKNGLPPKSKPLYFIMDHERASKERIYLKRYGYQLVSESVVRIFPTLTMLEMLQPMLSDKEEEEKIPLWEIAQRIKESERTHLTETLRQFAFAFKNKRELNADLKEAETALDWLGNIIRLSETQFKQGGKKGLDEKYASSVEKIMLSPFIQSRGRSGRVLVLNQDYIILLTNLVVGEKDKLRFHELISEFQMRGIFVDKQTELELIKFYERIGNVERMSDSGDAVYVRKTI